MAEAWPRPAMRQPCTGHEQPMGDDARADQQLAMGSNG